MSEIGMATTGMSTERNDPRKRKITTDDEEGLRQCMNTSLIAS